METKEMKIQVPEGYEIDRENSTFEKIVFKKVDDLPKSWEELEFIDGFFVSSLSDIAKIGNNTTNDKNNKNVFPTKEEAEALLKQGNGNINHALDAYKQEGTSKN